MNTVPHQPPAPPPSAQNAQPPQGSAAPQSRGHMIVCGDDALAERLAAELRALYGEQVTVVVPGAPGDGAGRVAPAARARASALLARMQSVLGRTPDQSEPAGPPRVQQAAVLDEQAFADAGVTEARALALVHDDDEINIRAALVARRLNPQLRLVIRLYNRSLGRHLADLLDQAAALSTPGFAPGSVDNSTTVLSDADTAAPALAASAVAGTSKIVQADGLLLRAVERNPPGPGQVSAPGLATLALLSATTNDPAGSEGSDSDGRDGPRLLPGDDDVAAATGRGTVVLETITPAERTAQSWSSAGRGMPFGSFFSKRLRWSLFGLTASVLGMAIATWATGDMHPLRAGYLTLLDLFAIDDPAIGEPTARKVLQLLTGLAGLLLLPVLLAAVLEALGTFRTSAALRRPPRGLSGHIVLLGLGKVGTRVLSRLGELDIPVVCVEADPEARGIPLARSMRVPTVIGDAASDGVLEAAKVHRAAALLALTSVDTTNLEAALSARALKPDLRVVLRLYDDAFAAAVYRTLRAAHPRALTRSRSVSTLAAPAFAGAMMGRQILGAIPVERSVLLFAVLEVAGYPQLEGRTIAESFRPGHWRVVALDATEPAERRPDLSAGPEDDESAPRPTGLVWNLHPGHVLDPRDRVVLAATRQGLAELLGRGPAPQRSADRADQT
ncbi:NAD-binding protein [Streptomyces sp. NPDC059639]|uniref:potassium channel family protein n=1 Tax=Streptomyces sp. NPDC059639 TaxID=3346891 RepID=UPI003698B93F